MIEWYDRAWTDERREYIEDLAYRLMLLPAPTIKIRILRLARTGVIWPEEAEGLIERFRLKEE